MNNTQKTHIQKFYGNYIFLVFILFSFALAAIYKKESIYGYYGIAIAIFALLFDNSFAKEFGFSVKVLVNRKLILYLIPSIILSNSLLVIMNNYFPDDGPPFNQNHMILGFIFLNSVRILGEEAMFRGFLLIKSIKEKNQTFWILNLTQAFVFTLIHVLFQDNLTGRLAIGIYGFALSVYFGWLNRKFNSILPSFIIHWMNGLQTLILFYL